VTLVRLVTGSGGESERRQHRERVPNCDQWFVFAIQMDRETWEGIRIASGLLERCAHCGASTRFAKVEYRFRSE